MSDAIRQVLAFARNLRQQIAVAEDAGADSNDLCVVFPAGFTAMQAGWPFVEIEVDEGELRTVTVALVPKLWARDRADEAVGETGLPPTQRPATSSMGLWATGISDLKDRTEKLYKQGGAEG